MMSPTGLRNPVRKPQEECFHHHSCGEQGVDLTETTCSLANDLSITRQEKDLGAKKPSG